jgi:hypothetical protein
MGYTAGKNVRIAVAALAAVVLTAGLSADAVAKAGKRAVTATAKPAQVASGQLGQMRYYGGPKSPMWREVR